MIGQLSTHGEMTGAAACAPLGVQRVSASFSGGLGSEAPIYTPSYIPPPRNPVVAVACLAGADRCGLADEVRRNIPPVAIQNPMGSLDGTLEGP